VIFSVLTGITSLLFALKMVGTISLYLR
jgi:hypothetical protein